MGEEVIKVLEYLKNSDIIKSFAIGYVIIGIIVLVLVISIFIIAFKEIMKNRRKFYDDFNKKDRK